MAIRCRNAGAHRHDTSAYGRVRIDRFRGESRKIHRSAVAPAATANRGHQLCGLPTGVGTRRRGRIAPADRPRVWHPRRCGRHLLAAVRRCSSTVRSVRLAGPFSAPTKACFPHGRSALPADCGRSPHVDGFTRTAPCAGRTSMRARCELRTCTDSGGRSQAMRLARTVGDKMPPWTNGRRWRV